MYVTERFATVPGGIVSRSVVALTDEFVVSAELMLPSKSIVWTERTYAVLSVRFDV